jgi:hypothetical protein
MSFTSKVIVNILHVVYAHSFQLYVTLSEMCSTTSIQCCSLSDISCERYALPMATQASLRVEFCLCFPPFFIFFFLSVGLLVSSNSVWGIQKNLKSPAPQLMPVLETLNSARDVQTCRRARLLLCSYRRSAHQRPCRLQPDTRLHYTEYHVQLWPLSVPHPTAVATQFCKFRFAMYYVYIADTECKVMYKWNLYLKYLYRTFLVGKVALVWSC